MASLLLLLALLVAGPSPASAAPGALDILVLHADEAPTELQAQILAEPGVANVDLVDVRFTTPTPSELASRDMVVVYYNNQYADAVTLGDELADYVDAGGLVTAMTFENLQFIDDSFRLKGRWDSGEYSPFTLTDQYGETFAELGTYDAGSPLMQGVTINPGSYYRIFFGLRPGATEVAQWSDGYPFVATKGRVLGINAYPSDGFAGQGTFGRIIVNGATNGLGGLVCTITGTAGVDRIRGTSGNDVICGLGGDDFLDGRGGNDTIIGGDGVDTLVGKAGNDTLVGGLGNDLLLPGAGNDSVDGGDGTRDRVLFSDITGGGVHVLLASGAVSPEGGSNVGSDTLSGIEQVFGSQQNDVLIAQIAGVASTVKGGAGDDQLDVGDGDGLDRAVGNLGDDTCVTDAGDSGTC